MDIQEQINEIKQQDTHESQVNLGVLYAYGPAAIRDYDLAIKCFEQAAQAGNSDGMFYLSQLYSQAVGVKRDLDLTAKYLQQAMELNNGKAYVMAYFFNNRFRVLDLRKPSKIKIKSKIWGRIPI